MTQDELVQLDRIEGCPEHYERHNLKISVQELGRVVEAVAYVAHPTKIKTASSPLVNIWRKFWQANFFFRANIIKN